MVSGYCLNEHTHIGVWRNPVAGWTTVQLYTENSCMGLYSPSLKELLVEGFGAPRCSWNGEDKNEMAKGDTGYQALLFKTTTESKGDREWE